MMNLQRWMLFMCTSRLTLAALMKLHPQQVACGCCGSLAGACCGAKFLWYKAEAPKYTVN